MRTIEVTIDGKDYTFPASMTVLRRAEKLCGITTALALTPGTDEFGSAGFVLGVVAAGVEHCGETFGIEKIRGERPGYIDAVGNRIAFDQADELYAAVYTALKPELVAQAQAGIEEVGESSDPPAGPSGSGSPTDCSGSNPASSTSSAGRSSGKP
jgi:hypothetical protein